jgi:2-polyprenyl-3-methyl-5-hydroxy-6-metoxy-1,4-benzoquinol methylase/uncharacterized protein YcfL
MFESIIKQLQIITYDFRHTAKPDDPLAYLFNDWLDYYKVKWAITNVLKPTSILEIGVRFGYSAAAFLHGYPTAHYVGIDLDTDTYGGVKGAINWARKITQPFAAEFIIADTQTMNRLPGNIYDLIHVDGQQDGNGSLHDLELAIKQARYVIVDGYLWTRQNFMAVSEFLFRYADIIDFYEVLPGYAGELLIKISPSYLSHVNQEQHYTVNSSLVIKQTYTNDYYIQDCGGFDAYKKYQGKILEDPRLQAVAAIASLKKQGRILDLGCGRGEITYYFAKNGFAVTAIDYSHNSIELAQKCFDGEASLKAGVQFHCDDVCTVPLQGQYELAIASDIIEHLSFTEVDTLYHRLANHLKPNGLFVIHTFPNLWYYQYEYPRKRRIAASVGAYLPAQPRTRYEMLMHINEQSPRVLKKQLSKYFEHVLVWFGDPSNPGGSLITKFSKQAVCAAPDLFAIASHQLIDREQVKSCFQMNSLPHIPAKTIRIVVTKQPVSVTVNSEFNVELEIANNSNFVLKSYNPNPVQIAYYWMDEKAVKSITYSGERSKILPPLNSPAKGIYQAKIKAPSEQGRYVLRMTLVQEFVRWFDREPTNLAEDIFITVD